ncbi:MAG: MetQ/NlpA family ABC transporter substrate-binding protein [Quadrisphaera sp.]
MKIGVADSSLPYWKTYTELAKSQLGVTVDLVNFSDYSLPNPALSQGEVDLNQFQHIQYLANYDATANDTIQPIGSTAVYPLPLYSTTVKDVASLPADAVVGHPQRRHQRGPGAPAAAAGRAGAAAGRRDGVLEDR